MGLKELLSLLLNYHHCWLKSFSHDSSTNVHRRGDVLVLSFIHIRFSHVGFFLTSFLTSWLSPGSYSDSCAIDMTRWQRRRNCCGGWARGWPDDGAAQEDGPEAEQHRNWSVLTGREHCSVMCCGRPYWAVLSRMPWKQKNKYKVAAGWGRSPASWKILVSKHTITYLQLATLNGISSITNIISNMYFLCINYQRRKIYSCPSL